jgi:hypothetical protein
MMSSGHHRSISSQDRVPLGLSIRNHSYPRRDLSQLVLESEAPLGERSSLRIVDVVVLELAEVPWVPAALEVAEVHQPALAAIQPIRQRTGQLKLGCPWYFLPLPQPPSPLSRSG